MPEAVSTEDADCWRNAMNDNNESTQDKQFRVLDFEPNCPDCAVAVGKPHEYDEYDGGCDVARCLVTGLQRLMCDRNHDHGRDIWTGWWPGLLFFELKPWGWPTSSAAATSRDHRRC